MCYENVSIDFLLHAFSEIEGECFIGSGGWTPLLLSTILPPDLRFPIN